MWPHTWPDLRSVSHGSCRTRHQTANGCLSSLVSNAPLKTYVVPLTVVWSHLRVVRSSTPARFMIHSSSASPKHPLWTSFPLCKHVAVFRWRSTPYDDFPHCGSCVFTFKKEGGSSKVDFNRLIHLTMQLLTCECQTQIHHAVTCELELWLEQLDLWVISRGFVDPINWKGLKTSQNYVLTLTFSSDAQLLSNLDQ